MHSIILILVPKGTELYLFALAPLCWTAIHEPVYIMSSIDCQGIALQFASYDQLKFELKLLMTLLKLGNIYVKESSKCALTKIIIRDLCSIKE